MIRSFATPGGHTAKLDCRPGTCDETTCSQVIGLDEYRIADLLPAGLPGATVIDVGGYIGSFAIPAILDLDVGLVVVIEPLAENCKQISRNADLNAVSEKVRIVNKAATRSARVEITFDYDDAYRFVGNIHDGHASHHSAASQIVTGVSLTALLDDLGCDDLPLLKIDCEGCEYDFLADPAVARVERIVGEWHGDAAALKKMLEGTHKFSVERYIFTADRR